MKRWLVLATLLAVFTRPAGAETITLRGRLIDRATQVGVGGARVALVDRGDTTRVRQALSDDDGSFAIAAVAGRSYRLEALRLGYLPLRQMVTADSSRRDLGALLMSATPVPEPAVVVRGNPPIAIQKADTTEFSARAFKTHPDATAEDLVQKMPGVTLQNGTVKTNGETVQQVLVDGRPFFGNDPTIALRNLPSDVIDRIQVFDKLSDQAEFTGFDDGQSQKVMNLVLRADRRRGQFGKVSGGAGDERRYSASGNENIFRGPNRYSVIALSNNVNQQNFSVQDILGALNLTGPRGGNFGGGAFRFAGRGGGGPRPGGGGNFGPGGFGGPGGAGVADFLVGQQDGVTTTNSAGGNYTGAWGRRVQASGSYFFNHTDNQNDQQIGRRYATSLDSIASYDQNSGSEARNTNHRGDARIEWSPDSANSVILLPRMSFQSTRSAGDQDAANLAADGSLLNESQSSSDVSTSGHNLSNHVVLRHRFATRGRTLSIDAGAAHTLKEGPSLEHSELDYAAGSGVPGDTLDQRTALHTTTSTLSATAAYTEPAGPGIVQLTYSPSVTKSVSDNRAYDLDPATSQYALPDTGLSNSFTSESDAQSGGIGYRIRHGGLNGSGTLSYQSTRLRSDREFPGPARVRRTFGTLLPSFFVNWNLPDHRNLRLSLQSATRNPTIGQLQDVVDNSNPLQLSTGNPALDPSTVNTLVLRFSRTTPARSRSLFVLLSVQRTGSTIGNSTLTAANDTTLAGGLILHRGTQLVRPVNLGDSWSVNSFVTYSRPIAWMKSVLNLSGGVTSSLTPGLVNGVQNTADTWAITHGAVLASNISEAVDFTVAYNGTYNLARNSLDSGLDRNDYSHTLALRLNLIGPRGIGLRDELTHNLATGLGSGYDQNAVLWNTGVAKKFLAEQRGELRFTASDLLNQNRSTNRTVTELYVQDTRNRTLGPYYLVTFTYNMK